MIHYYNICMYTAGMLPWDVIETLKHIFLIVQRGKKSCRGGGGLNQWHPNEICITNYIHYAKSFGMCMYNSTIC